MGETNAPSRPVIRCKRCNYDLHGLAAEACPECGRPFDPADELTYASTLPSRKLLYMATLAGVVIAMIPLALMYLEAATARSELGRWPVPSMDDPKGISSIQALHTFTLFSLVCVPSGFAICLWTIVLGGISDWRRASLERWTSRVLVHISVVAICFGALWLFVSADPWRFVEWWFD